MLAAYKHKQLIQIVFILLFGRIVYLAYKMFDVVDLFTTSPFLPDYLNDWMMRPYLILIGFYLLMIFLIFLIFKNLKKLDTNIRYIQILIAFIIAMILFIDGRMFRILRELTWGVTTLL